MVEAVPRYRVRKAWAKDSEIVFLMKKAALGPAIDATWGWDEEFQKAWHGRHFKAKGTGIVMVADEEVGVLRVERRAVEIHLAQLYLRPSWQGKGIGGTILRYLKKGATETRLPIRLEVLRENARAVAFFERNGFEYVKTKGEKHTYRWSPSD